MATDDTHIGQNIARLRKRSGLSQAALAKNMASEGVRWSQVTVSEVEKGGRRLALTEAAALCRTLSPDNPLSVDALLQGDEDKDLFDQLHRLRLQFTKLEDMLLELTNTYMSVELEVARRGPESANQLTEDAHEVLLAIGDWFAAAPLLTHAGTPLDPPPAVWSRMSELRDQIAEAHGYESFQQAGEELDTRISKATRASLRVRLFSTIDKHPTYS